MMNGVSMRILRESSMYDTITGCVFCISILTGFGCISTVLLG